MLQQLEFPFADGPKEGVSITPPIDTVSTGKLDTTMITNTNQEFLRCVSKLHAFMQDLDERYASTSHSGLTYQSDLEQMQTELLQLDLFPPREQKIIDWRSDYYQDGEKVGTNADRWMGMLPVLIEVAEGILQGKAQTGKEMWDLYDREIHAFHQRVLNLLKGEKKKE